MKVRDPYRLKPEVCVKGADRRPKYFDVNTSTKSHEVMPEDDLRINAVADCRGSTLPSSVAAI